MLCNVLASSYSIDEQTSIGRLRLRVCTDGWNERPNEMCFASVQEGVS